MWYFEPVWKFREKGMDGQTAGGTSPGGQPPAARKPRQPSRAGSSFYVRTDRHPGGDYVRTSHNSPTYQHRLEVFSNLRSPDQHPAPTQEVQRHAGGMTTTETAGYTPPKHTVTMATPNRHDSTRQLHIHHDGTTEVTRYLSRPDGSIAEHREAVTPASPDLRQMIANHHKDHAWMPLVDKLAEEYPEHFQEATDHHTAGRQQYAEKVRRQGNALARLPVANRPAQLPRPTA